MTEQDTEYYNPKYLPDNIKELEEKIFNMEIEMFYKQRYDGPIPESQFNMFRQLLDEYHKNEDEYDKQMNEMGRLLVKIAIENYGKTDLIPGEIK